MGAGIYQSMFWGVSFVGRPFGGIRPRRVTHWLADKAFSAKLDASQYRWVRDRWGNELRLNPHYYIDRNIIAFGLYDENVHAVIADRVKPGMVCFDVGSNIGEMALHMGRKVGAAGKVYAFEPVALVRARLESHVARNGLSPVVDVRGVALSDRVGTVEMSVAPEETGNQGMASIVNNSCSELTNRCVVPTTTIDAFVEAEKITRIDLMKIDIQGAEPLLLAGGKNVFGRLGPDLIMEISEGDLAGIGRTGRDLVAELEGYGYGVYAIDSSAGKPGRRVRAAELTANNVPSDVLCTKSPV